MARTTKRSVLACLTKKRLFEIDRQFEIGTPQAQPKDDFIEGLAGSKAASFRKVVDALSLAERRAVCRAHELPVSGSKAELGERILGDDAPAQATPDAPDAGHEGPRELTEARSAQVSLALEGFFARSHPTVRGIVPLLERAELAAVLRRLDEQHGVHLELATLAPGITSLAAALEEQCELGLLLAELDRERLAKICSQYALTSDDASRDGYIRAILAAAAGLTVDEALAVEATPVPPDASGPPAPGAAVRADTEAYRAALAALPRGVLHRIEADLDPGKAPQPGEIVRARHRQYVVTGVVPPADPEHRNPRTGLRAGTRVKLVCLDDDAQGRELELVWELELGAERIDPARQGLGAVKRFDEPDAFEAYYRTLQWSCVTTATRPDDERVQAPFRAGIAVMQHQLVPLQRVLALPRANLFIADDVGLGKTIEAGLILQEMLLRQRLDLILIVCPASICLQWQGELERRFGIRFEIVNREHLARIRRQRGAATNPWDCGRHFIVSYQTLRRPEYQELLLLALDRRGPKSMLVLDEAHNVAPASDQQHYAVDSKLTKLARAIAPKFENRLFLSATPHNGHSNSFSALLELLDPARFTRGVPIDGEGLRAVMVRRLKRDLIGTTSLQFPRRELVELRLVQEADAWSVQRAVRGEAEPSPSRSLAPRETHELELSELLAAYTKLCAPSAKRDRRVFIGLQKRLLSSCAAFQRTLQVHLRKTGQRILEALPPEPPDSGASEDGELVAAELDRALEDAVAGGGALPGDTSQRQQAQAQLDRMQELVRAASSRPEGKILALVEWIRAHQCPAAGSQWFSTPASTSRAWSDTRLLVFTEYSHTAEYIIKMLRAALAGTEREDERIAYFHGGTPDDSTTGEGRGRSPGRRELQANFNARPDKHPVRILVATDAAREGVNFQAHCADLIHYDIPWNPGRLEQRNGRIDRTLQPSPVVRCMYFAYPQRREDRVLQVLVEKVERIQRELGSLSAVILERIEDSLEPHGIDDGAQRRLELAGEGDAGAREVATREVESMGSDPKRLRQEIEAAGDCYARSRAFFAPDAEGLRETVGVALALGGSAGGFETTAEARDPGHPDETPHYRVPTMPADWARTLDTLRPPKPRELAWWEWRNEHPPRPVAFEPLRRMTDDVIQLHLEHPLVRRALGRFTAQGYAAHDLHRASLMQYAGTRERIVLVGRVSLFGAGATRLHDGLLHRIADLRSDGEAVPLVGEAEQATALRQMREAMRRPGASWTPSPELAARRLARVDADIATLWPLLHTQAEDEAAELVRLLDDRGAREAEQLVGILRALQTKIRSTLARDEGPPAAGAGAAETAWARQRRLDRDHMQTRLKSIDDELQREPEKLRRHYAVLTQRIEAVGIVYLVPETR